MGCSGAFTPYVTNFVRCINDVTVKKGAQASFFVAPRLRQW
jgi:hypothetical protein